MRFAGNFHPEWGYLAPAPNFMRTVRIVAVATAIGATAGAAVVLSLADHPASNPVADAGKSLVVVHSLVQPAEAATPATAPAPAPTAALAAPPVIAQPAPTTASPPQHVQASAQPIAPTPPGVARQPAPMASDSSTMATSQPPASVAALSESPPATEVARASDVAIVAPVPAAPLAPVAPAVFP
ncbi:MAG TPA: hypothetical protein VMR17_22120, partial [Xanthobacteraceae bacterium]|nr:hypothetical protein [Xanthobacteraceae bacterium]